MPHSIPLSKSCTVNDFANPGLSEAIRQVFPHEAERFGPGFPVGVEYRKHWEVGMAALALREGGALRPDAEILGVGVGNEPTLFWLTNHVRRVFATDIYADDAWDESSSSSMLTEPERHWPGLWNPRRLVVQHMDGRALRFEDDSFDAVFSSSSIEHFGTFADARASVQEMHRVLKPGGVLSLSTELRLAGAGPGLPGILMFSPEELHELVVAGLDWAVAPSWSLVPDPQSLLDPVVPFEDATADVREHVAANGRIYYERLDWSTYPHVVLSQDDLVWTSVHVAAIR
jgi:SAM-dependent methyltransferase